MVEKIRTYRVSILLSWVITAVGAGLMVFLDSSSSATDKDVFQILLSLGVGPCRSVLNLPLQASVQNVDDMGFAAGILVSFRLFGGLIGLAAASSIFNSISAQNDQSLGTLTRELAPFNDAREAVGFIPWLRYVDAMSPLLDEVVEAYENSISGVWWMILGASILAFVVSWFIKEEPLEREDLGRQAFENNKLGISESSNF